MIGWREQKNILKIMKVNKALLQGGVRDFPKPGLWLLAQAPKKKALQKIFWRQLNE